jgi:hypothetical protein
MAMIAAGTSAPTPLAAKAKPSNHEGRSLMIRSGTAKLGLVSFSPAAIAM